MNDLPRILCLLRKEKKLSQRAAAKQLGISQSLLSHYEKGSRECGLAFLTRTADFYEVSCDYLLGRTGLRNGVPAPENGEPVLTGKENLFSGSVFPALGKALTVSSFNVLFDMLKNPACKELASEVQKYTGLVIYQLFRHIYTAFPGSTETFFGLPEEDFLATGNAALLLCERRLGAAARRMRTNADSLPDTGYDFIQSSFPKDSAALFNIVKNAENEIKKLN
jgi:transcriptional regulator with XRE-family HTH domain